MSLPWFAIPTAHVLGSTRTHVYEHRPPQWVMVAEVRAIAIAGEFGAWSQRQFATRWKTSTKVVRSVLVESMRGTAEEPELARVRTAITEKFQSLAGMIEPPRNRRGTAEEPVHARAPSSEREKEKEKEKNNTPAKPAVDSVPYAEMVVWLSAHMPGAARVTSKRRPKLKRIWKDYDRATLERLGAWLAAKQHPRARYLADKGHGIDTVIAKVDQYVELMDAPIQVSDSRGPSIDDLLNHHPERVVLDAPLMLGGPNGQS